MMESEEEGYEEVKVRPEIEGYLYKRGAINRAYKKRKDFVAGTVKRL